MAYIWKCLNCDWNTPGTAEDSPKGLNHHKEVKKRGEDKHTIVLADAETGAPVLAPNGKPIKALSQAQKLGLIPGKLEEPSKPGKPGEPPPTKALKGTIRPIEVPLDPRLQFLYEWDKIILPEYQGNLSEWIWECVMCFHVQNESKFKLGSLFGEKK